MNYDALLKLRASTATFSWTERDALLYAVAVGFGQDALGGEDLDFVYERRLKVAPSFATVAAWNSTPSIAQAGVSYRHIVHAEQGVVMHRPLPGSARVTVSGGVTGAVDKGDKGALIHGVTVLSDADDGEAYATLQTSWFARADGHFGGPITGGPEPDAPPNRPPDWVEDYPTTVNQGLIYRLMGDRNPLHVDPEAAREAGFDRPILHGLCTYGVTCRAVLKTFAAFDPERIASHWLRFSAPVFPGETLRIEFWKAGAVLLFQAWAKERGVLVVRNGKTILHA